MFEERSILFEYAHICGDCAVEYLDKAFRRERFEAWLNELVESSQPLMRHGLERTSDITRTNPGCACCWGEGRNVPGTYAIELQIDGDG